LAVYDIGYLVSNPPGKLMMMMRETIRTASLIMDQARRPVLSDSDSAFRTESKRLAPDENRKASGQVDEL
jgi:hypothetical protein